MRPLHLRHTLSLCFRVATMHSLSTSQDNVDHSTVTRPGPPISALEAANRALAQYAADPTAFQQRKRVSFSASRSISPPSITAKPQTHCAPFAPSQDTWKQVLTDAKELPSLLKKHRYDGWRQKDIKQDQTMCLLKKKLSLVMASQGEGPGETSSSF